MVKVSIVIPVYNTEKYLCECLESIIGQTLQDIEVICVDDGSTDGSSEILDDYTKRDSRVTVIHKKNNGSIAARKTGIHLAQGQYIGFVDSDDWIETYMYEKLYSLAARYKVDFVSSGYFREGNYTTIQFDNIKEGLYREKQMKEFRNSFIYNMQDRVLGMSGSMCCKLYKADILKRLEADIPDSMVFSEDKMCNLLFVLNCSSAFVAKEAYYHYRMRSNSVVHTSHKNYLLQVNDVYQYLMKLYLHSNFTRGMRVQAELYITETLIHGINQRMGFINRNLLWVDPYWLKEIPKSSKVVLYDAGELGEKYRIQLESQDDLIYAGCVDYGFKKYTSDEFEVQPPEILKKMEYDNIIITIKNHQKAEDVREQLIRDGVDENKILWFEQKEIFWKFAEADGLLDPRKYKYED